MELERLFLFQIYLLSCSTFCFFPTDRSKVDLNNVNFDDFAFLHRHIRTLTQEGKKLFLDFVFFKMIDFLK